MRIDDLFDLLDEYDAKVGLKKAVASSAADKYLDLPSDTLSKMTGEELAEAEYALSNYCVYLQREINRQSAIMKWCNIHINNIIVGKLDQYGGKFQTNDNKRLLAIKDDEAASKVFRLYNHADIRLADLSYIPSRIELVIKSISSLRQSRRHSQ